MNIRYVFFLWIVFLSSLTAYAQIGGSSVYNFLSLPVSSTTAALGGDGVALLNEDVSQGFTNPALYNPLQNKRIAFHNAFYYTGIDFGSLSFARYFPEKKFTLGAGLQYINYGKQQGYNLYGTPLGDFTAGEYALNVAYSQEIAKNLRAGAAVKLLASFLESYASFAVAFDAGLVYSDSLGLNTLAISIQNAGRQLKTYSGNQREPLPLNVKIGFAKNFRMHPFRFFISAHHLQTFDIQYADPANGSTNPFIGDTLSVNGNSNSTGDKIMAHFIIGTELLLGKNLSIRFGYNHLRRQELKLSARSGLTGFSFGAGVGIKRFRLDYALSVYHLVGATHQLGISTNLGTFIPGLN